MAKAYYTGYLTRKVLHLLIDPWKLWNFSTLNDLQYTVYDLLSLKYILNKLLLLLTVSLKTTLNVSCDYVPVLYMWCN